MRVGFENFKLDAVVELASLGLQNHEAASHEPG
jgi:hypothetical protein